MVISWYAWHYSKIMPLLLTFCQGCSIQVDQATYSNLCQMEWFCTLCLTVITIKHTAWTPNVHELPEVAQCNWHECYTKLVRATMSLSGTICIQQSAPNVVSIHNYVLNSRDVPRIRFAITLSLFSLDWLSVQLTLRTSISTDYSGCKTNFI